MYKKTRTWVDEAERPFRTTITIMIRERYKKFWIETRRNDLKLLKMLP